MLGFQRLCLAVVLVVVGLGAAASPAYAVETVTVSGVVLGHDGLPVQGATIQVVPAADTDECPEADDSTSPSVLATTDAAGRFAFTCTADFPWVEARLPSGEFAGWRTFQPGVYDDIVFRAYAGRGTVEGTVYDQYGEPATDAEIMFIWDVPGAGAYDYFRVDSAAGYRVDELFPGARYTVAAFLDGVGIVEEFVFTATEGVITHDLLVQRPDRVDQEAPGGAITATHGTHRRLKVSGWAYDDSAVAKVKVAIRNRATGRWLRLNGSWGRYQRHVVRMTKPGEPRTGWWLTKRLRPGRYGVSLVVVDASGNRNVGPRPWRPIRVRR